MVASRGGRFIQQLEENSLRAQLDQSEENLAFFSREKVQRDRLVLRSPFGRWKNRRKVLAQGLEAIALEGLPQVLREGEQKG